MLPIHQLLSRIRWDARYRRGRFELAYLDHMARGLVVVPLEAIRFPAHARDRIEILDEDGEVRSIPLHRIRRVWRDGRIIWERTRPGETRNNRP